MTVTLRHHNPVPYVIVLLSAKVVKVKRLGSSPEIVAITVICTLFYTTKFRESYLFFDEIFEYGIDGPISSFTISMVLRWDKSRSRRDLRSDGHHLHGRCTVARTKWVEGVRGLSNRR